MTWVIAFEDGDDKHFWRMEIYKRGEFLEYGKVKTFKTKEDAVKFMLSETDSRAFDFFAKEVSNKEIKAYEEKAK